MHFRLEDFLEYGEGVDTRIYTPKPDLPKHSCGMTGSEPIELDRKMENHTILHIAILQSAVCS